MSDRLIGETEHGDKVYAVGTPSEPTPLEPECPRCVRMAANVEKHRKEVVDMFRRCQEALAAVRDDRKALELNLNTALRMAEALEQEAREERRELERELERTKREAATAWDHNADVYARMAPLADNLTATQTRCNELLEEARVARRELEAVKEEKRYWLAKATTLESAMGEIRGELNSLPGENILVTVRRVAAKLRGG